MYLLCESGVFPPATIKLEKASTSSIAFFLKAAGHNKLDVTQFKITRNYTGVTDLRGPTCRITGRGRSKAKTGFTEETVSNTV